MQSKLQASRHPQRERCGWSSGLGWIGFAMRAQKVGWCSGTFDGRCYPCRCGLKNVRVGALKSVKRVASKACRDLLEVISEFAASNYIKLIWSTETRYYLLAWDNPTGNQSDWYTRYYAWLGAMPWGHLKIVEFTASRFVRRVNSLGLLLRHYTSFLTSCTLGHPSVLFPAISATSSTAFCTFSTSSSLTPSLLVPLKCHRVGDLYPAHMMHVRITNCASNSKRMLWSERKSP